MPAQSIDEVIEELDEVIAWANRENNPIGIFAALYRVMTDKVREGLREGFFLDPVRMEKLDVIFANRYLVGLNEFRAGRHTRQAWQKAYECSQKWDYSILQYLIIAINAHISLDLGISTAQAMEGGSIMDIREDFLRINSVIYVLTEPLQEEVEKLSPLAAFAYRRLNKGRQNFLDFSMRVAREYAWGLASDLSTLPRDKWESRIQEADEVAKRVGQVILKKKFPLGFFIWCVRMMETNSVEKVTTQLLKHTTTLEACQVCLIKMKSSETKN